MEGVKGEFRGRCEKIDLQMWSEFGAKKSRSRMLLNLDLGPSARTPGLKSETWATRPPVGLCGWYTPRKIKAVQIMSPETRLM